IKQDLYTRLGARPDAVVRILIDQPATTVVMARVGPVPAYGWSRAVPVPLEHPVAVNEAGGGVVLGNGLVTVTVDPENGTFAVDDIPGFGRIVDGGDHGDSYNFSPPLHDTIIDVPLSVSIAVSERGPVRAVATVTTTYLWPERVDDGTRSRVGEEPATVVSEIEVRADEAYVRVHARFVNPSRDHRVRVHLPLPTPADHSDAECAFAVVRRGLETEGRVDELGLATFPARRFVSAGGLTVAHDAVTEYELVDIADGRARTLALTLLRSTGMLSRLGMAYRPLPAGPLTPVEGLELQGRVIEARYALAISCDNPYAMVDDVFAPLEVVHGAGGGDRLPLGTALEVTGGEVSAVRRVGGSLELRLFNPTAHETTVTMARSGWLVDLRGRPLRPVDGTFSLRPFGIATIRLGGA
ncbi:MAG TPA: glycoside hydrolase family 38 C-terminal domain-containing protein, partial [Acidimicrobiales bacterium]|nr:glycoside hydrolase family 38 C-terminal domain-containing protein [Acidimicrobiales bacterium]